MKTEISRHSHQPDKRYSGVYQQQGRMLTDADWNELVDILKQRLQNSLKDVIGNRTGSFGGTPRQRGLKLEKASSTSTVQIRPGQVYVAGLGATLPGRDAVSFLQQPDFPAASAPGGEYRLYADVWERTVTQLMDERLRDKGLHGADTCTRQQMLLQVKWCPAAIDPQDPARNPARGNGRVSATLLRRTTQPDPCDPCASTVDVESNIGNYLFRVEVHDVRGDASAPTEVTFKWSSENAAEQLVARPKAEMPAGFVANQYVYEFFSEVSEKHLGVHLQPDTAFVVREKLHDSYPGTLPAGFDLVRRWDGYATFRWDDDARAWNLFAGVSGNISLAEAAASTRADKVLSLDSIELKLQLLTRVSAANVTSVVPVAGDLDVNGRPIAPLAGFDVVSTRDNDASAITKAQAINQAFSSVTDSSRVWCRADATRVVGVAPSLFTGLTAGLLKINTVPIGAVEASSDRAAQAEAIKNAINLAFPGAEIVAATSADGALSLDAADGRNIDIEISGADTGKQCGLTAGTTYGGITLASRIAITVSGNNPAAAGLVAGVTAVMQCVAGDFWLADVREVEHQAGSVVMADRPPLGIMHHYLTLGAVDATGELVDNAEADRKFAFPSLSEMTRLFQVGGDGQEAMPGHELDHPLEVAVANGQWPVAGARLRFRIVTADGSGLLKAGSAADALAQTVETGADGIARCRWELGPPNSADPRVEVTLLDPDAGDGRRSHDHPPIFFNANLSVAGQVFYQNPTCEAGATTVNTLLEGDLGDAWPDSDGDGDSTVKDVLDAILCLLRARHIPYDATNQARWNDINAEEQPTALPPKTVQEAIDDLLENLHSEDIKYPLPDCDPDENTFKSHIAAFIDNKVIEGATEFARIKDLWDAVLCHLDAAKLPYDPNNKLARWLDILDEAARGWTTAAPLTLGGVGLAGDVAADTGDRLIAIASAIGFDALNQAQAEFVLRKLDSNGDPDWSQSFAAVATSLALDAKDNIFVSGFYNRPVDFGGGPLGLNRQSVSGENPVSNRGTGSATVAARNVPAANTIAAQKLSIDIAGVVRTFEVATGDEASTIAGAVNELPDIAAVATTRVTMKSPSAAGTVTFKLATGAARAVTVTADIADTSDLSLLAAGVNAASARTGIEARLNAIGGVELLQPQGGNIRIADFTHSAAGGSIVVHGSGDSSVGQALTDGGNNSVLVAGIVEFYFDSEFKVSSSIDAASGSVLDAAADAPVDSADASGKTNCFVAKFDSSGAHLWSAGFGEWGRTIATGLAVDADGDAVVCGNFNGTTDIGGERLQAGSGEDSFVCKLAGGDGRLAWLRPIQNAGDVQAGAVEAGGDSDIVVAGKFTGAVDLGGDSLVSEGLGDAFVARLGAADGAFTWSRRFGGLGEENGVDLALGPDNDLYLLAGSTGDIDVEGELLAKIGASDILVIQLAYDDASVGWSRRFGGGMSVSGAGIEVAGKVSEDKFNLLVSGHFSDTARFGEWQLQSAGADDAFLAILDPEGNPRWSTRAGDADTERGMGLAVQSAGQIAWNWAEVPPFVIPGNAQQSAFQLWIIDDINDLDLPVTVQRAIDELLENLESSDIAYRLPACGGSIDSLRKRLDSIAGLADHSELKIDSLLDALLCELDAASIPFDHHSASGSLRDGFVDAAGDTMTGALRIQDDLQVDGDCTIDGNLQVNGTMTTVNSQELTIDDPIITLNRYDNNAPNVNDSGIEVYRGSSARAQLRWNESLDRWEYGTVGNMVPITAADQALVTGAVTFNNMPVGTMMRSDWIDPGLGVGKLCVVLGNRITASLSGIGDENSSFRDVVFRVDVNRNDGRFRIYARRPSGSGRQTRTVEWWAMMPGQVQNDQSVSITINISPPSASLSPNQSLDFNATVTGTTNTAVSWSVQEGAAGGSVNANGLYTAPATGGEFHVVATSQADSAISDSATITVSKPKEKDAKDFKDAKEKEKDKELKEKDKDLKEKDKEFDVPGGGGGVVIPRGVDGIALELSADENREDPLPEPGGRAFIVAAERPDLGKPPGGSDAR